MNFTDNWSQNDFEEAAWNQMTLTMIEHGVDPTVSVKDWFCALPPEFRSQVLRSTAKTLGVRF